MKFKSPIIFIFSLVFVIGLSISLQSLLAAWNNPTATPPGANIAEPINATSTFQTKGGGLWVNVGGNVYSGAAFAVPYGNVGIGTVNPSSTLQINSVASGGTQPSTLFLVNEGYGAGTGNSIQFGTTPSGANKVAQIRSSVVGNNNGDLMFDTANSTDYSNVMTLKGNGNVGIGTTNPLSNLDIGGANPGSFSISSGGSIDLKLRGGSDYNAIDSQRTNDLNFQINSVSKMTLRGTTGNVGIGTTSPSQALSVNGNAYVSGTVSAGGFSGPLTGTLSAGNVSSGAFGSNTGGGNYSFPGNVGIGITNPGAKLEVSRTIANNDWNALTISNVGSWGGATNKYAEMLFTDGINNVAGIGATYNGTYGRLDFNALYNAGSGALSSVAMSILGSGNVGIGTTNPAAKLEVAGNIELGTSNILGWRYSAGDPGPYQYIKSDGAVLGYYSGSYTSSQTVDVHSFFTYNSGWLERLSILNNGNVGIGTTNPISKLHVNSFDSSPTYVTVGNTNNGVLVGVQTDGTPTIYNYANKGMVFGGNYNSTPTTQMVINSTGNVGIGTTNPGSKLSISAIGVANTPLTMMQVFNNIPYVGGNGVGAARIELGHGNLHGYIEGGSMTETDSSSGYMAFGTRRPVNSVVEAMRIDYNGNVGIGTTNPTEKLEVNGNIKADSAIILGGVSRTTWPGAGNDSPFFIETIYGDGDLPWRSTATTPQTMRAVYAPFGYAMPACGSGYTKWYRLYGELVDNSSGGQLVYARINFMPSGTNLDFNLNTTWGGSPSYRTYLSSPFQTANGDHANIQAWINGTAGPYLEIRKLQIWAYCL